MPVTQTTKANAITVKNLKLPYLNLYSLQFYCNLILWFAFLSHLLYISKQLRPECASAIRCDGSLLRHGDHSLKLLD